MIVVRIRPQKKIAGPPYIEFYRLLGVEWSPILDEYLIIQPSRGGLRLIILEPRKTTTIARKILHCEKVEIIDYRTLKQYAQQIIAKLVHTINRQIKLKTLTPAIIEQRQTIQLITKLKPRKTKIRIKQNKAELEITTFLSKENLPIITNLVIYGVGKNKSLGYGTIIWK